jgi:hypothetical protein
MGLELALSTILSPVVLFFVLGLVAALARSQMTVPEAFGKGLAIYLMMAIGLKGGVEMAKSPFTLQIALVFLAATLLSFLIPVLAFFFLRTFSKLPRIDAVAVAAHYGSISIVTFVAATQAVAYTGAQSSGYLVAIAAVMEAPAIITALMLYAWGERKKAQGKPTKVAGAEGGELMREVLLNASVVVLVGALIIGFVTGEEGFERIEPFFVTPFQGVLCLFLLDMGLSAGRGLRQGWRQLGIGAVGFGLYMPVISALIATAVCAALRLPAGDAALLITLSASASYIAVPAAMRLALPKAKPSIYLTLSLGVTFPFNLTIGIPLYITLANLVGQ